MELQLLVLELRGHVQVRLPQPWEELRVSPETGSDSKGAERLPDFSFVFVFLPFLGLLPQHMEVPRIGVKSEV